MGNGESAYDDPYDDFLRQPTDHAGSSMNRNYPNKGKSTYIADHFHSLDEVCTTTLDYYYYYFFFWVEDRNCNVMLMVPLLFNLYWHDFCLKCLV